MDIFTDSEEEQASVNGSSRPASGQSSRSLNEEAKFYSTEKTSRSDTKKGADRMAEEEVVSEKRTETGDGNSKDGLLKKKIKKAHRKDKEKISVSGTSLTRKYSQGPVSSLTRKYSQGSVSSLRSRSSIKSGSSVKVKGPTVEEKAGNKSETFGSRASIKSTSSETSAKGSRISLKSQTEFDTKIKTTDESNRNVRGNERSGSIVSMGSKEEKKKSLTGSRISVRSKNSFTTSIQGASAGFVASVGKQEYANPKIEVPEVTVEQPEIPKQPRNLDASEPSLREEPEEEQDDMAEYEENEPEPTAQDVTEEILEDLVNRALMKVATVKAALSENQIECEEEKSKTSENDIIDDGVECQENVYTDENLIPKDADTEDDVDVEGKIDENMEEETNQNEVLVKCRNGTEDKFHEEKEEAVTNLDNTMDDDIAQNMDFAETDQKIEQENVERRRGIKKSRQLHQSSVPTILNSPIQGYIFSIQKLCLHPQPQSQPQPQPRHWCSRLANQL